MAVKTALLAAVALLALAAAGSAHAEEVARLGADDATLIAKWSEAAFKNRKLLAGAPNAIGNDTVSTYKDQAPVPTKQEVLNLFQKWDDALLTKDPEKVVDLYAPDSVLLPTLSDTPRTDRAGKIAYFVEFLKKSPKGHLNTAYVRVLAPDVAINSGLYTFTVTVNGTTSDVGARYTFVYKKFGDKWLIVEHHSSKLPGQP